MAGRERVTISNFGKRIELKGKGIINATKDGVVVNTFDESATPRSRSLFEGLNTPTMTFPDGTVEALLPLLREVYEAYPGMERDDTYWDVLEMESTMTPREAVTKMKRANKKGLFNFDDVAAAMLLKDMSLQNSKGWERITPHELKTLQDLTASKVYEKSRKRK